MVDFRTIDLMPGYIGLCRDNYIELLKRFVFDLFNALTVQLSELGDLSNEMKLVVTTSPFV